MYQTQFPKFPESWQSFSFHWGLSKHVNLIRKILSKKNVQIFSGLFEASETDVQFGWRGPQCSRSLLQWSNGLQFVSHELRQVDHLAVIHSRTSSWKHRYQAKEVHWQDKTSWSAKLAVLTVFLWSSFGLSLQVLNLKWTRLEIRISDWTNALSEQLIRLYNSPVAQVLTKSKSLLNPWHLLNNPKIVSCQISKFNKKKISLKRWPFNWALVVVWLAAWLAD